VANQAGKAHHRATGAHMPHGTWSVDIARPQAEVFAFVAEGVNTPQWRKAAVDDRWLDEGPMRPGRRGRAVRKGGGMTFVLVAEIIGRDPPRSVTYRIMEGKLAGLEESYRFEPLDHATRLTITVDGPPYPNNVVGKLLNPLFERAMVRQGRADFVTLKKLLESEATVG
jgi:hypothetical protein